MLPALSSIIPCFNTDRNHACSFIFLVELFLAFFAVELKSAEDLDLVREYGFGGLAKIWMQQGLVQGNPSPGVPA